MLKKSFRGPPGGSGRGFQRVLNIHFNIESSWHRFLVDFWWVLGGAGGAKIWFSHRSGYNFYIFGYLKISCLLDPKKDDFGTIFGGPGEGGNAHVGF